MTKYLTEYRQYILDCLRDETCDLAQLLDYHREKIGFFQHERFIHLIVTALFAVLTIMTFIAIAVWQTVALIPLAALFLALLVAYIKHYYFLENTVQQLYKDYDVIYSRLYKITQEDVK